MPEFTPKAPTKRRGVGKKTKSIIKRRRTNE